MAQASGGSAIFSGLVGGRDSRGEMAKSHHIATALIELVEG